jgi:hypothetical protein
MQAFWIATLVVAAVTLLNRKVPILRSVMLALFLQLCLFSPWFEFGERHRYFLLPTLLLLVAIQLTGRRSLLNDACESYGKLRQSRAVRQEDGL